MSNQLTATGILAAISNLQNIIKALPNLKSDTETAVIDASKKAAKQQTKDSLEAAGISGPIVPKSKCASGEIMGKNGKCVARGVDSSGDYGIGSGIGYAPLRGGAKDLQKTRKAEKIRKMRKKTHRKI